MKVKKASSYQLVSQDGKVVLSGELSGAIDVSNVDRGIYFLRLRSGDNQIVRKLIVE